jgi:hypothetical protein
MKNLFFKISMAFILSFNIIDVSSAEPTCCIKMYSPSVAEEWTPEIIDAYSVPPYMGVYSAAPIDAYPVSPHIEAYFVYPHMENEEADAAADGVGANFSVQF